jgi:HSP20 family protein
MTYFAYTSGSPFARRAVRRDLHRLFDQAFQMPIFQQAPASDSSTDEQVTWQPSVDARETAQHFTFELDLPGVAPETVEVLAADGALTVRGSRPVRNTVEGERAITRERGAGRFSRTFRLPKTADLQKVSASSALGVLTIQVMKAEPVQPVRVPINVASTTNG